jgi:FkbM family methyltransferase
MIYRGGKMRLVNDLLWERLHAVGGSTGRNNNKNIVDLFEQLCIAIKPDIFLEIGAHGAEFSSLLASKLANTKIYAFEANSHVYEKYKNRVDPKVIYINKAVGIDSQNKNIYIPRSIPSGDGFMNLSLVNLTTSLKKRENDKVTSDVEICECTTVDDVIYSGPSPKKAILWIDVEGAVGEVLFGAHRALKGDVAALFIEIEKVSAWSGQWLAPEIDQYLEMLGFVQLARDSETSWQFNQIYIKKEYLKANISNLVKIYIDKISCVDKKND